MFLLEFVTGDYWKVTSCGEIVYAAGPNQKTLTGYNVTDSPDYENMKDKTYVDFIWDDKKRHMYLMTEDLKIEIYRQEKLKECRNRLKPNPTIIPEQALTSIAVGIKTAKSKADIDFAVKQIDNNIDAILNRIGF